MLDIRLIRENPILVTENIKRRNDPEKLKFLKELINADSKWREIQTQLNQLRQKRNESNIEIIQLKKQGKSIEKLLKDAEKISQEIKKLEEQSEKSQKKVKSLLMKIPNLLHESVPVGKDDGDNVEVKRIGTAPIFDFKPKNHLEIIESLGLIDSEKATKISGAGFVYLKNELALLDLAIQRFAIGFLMKRGYNLIEPPFMVKREPYEGVTDLSDFENVMYKIEGEDLYLIATSEHPMAAMFKDDVLTADQLPIKFIGVSPCFRREIGAHGKYTKGLFRMHQFNKIEQFIFCLPDQSWKFHEELQKNCEELYEALGIHFRVVNVCTGDIGSIAAKKYDTEFWMSDGVFREIGSNSNCTDYQARRLNIRYRLGPGKPVEGFVHTLNNTAFATSRTMVAILEQFQQKDGSVLIPKVLQPFMNDEYILGKKKYA
jgi:seryl-tRNA synthetase